VAISTYSELQAAAANFLVRADLTARIPEFVALAEARLNRIVRKRQAQVDAALTGTVSSRTIALPATFSEALNFWIVRSGERQALNYRDPALMEASAVASEPLFWGIDGANVVFERPCASAYSFVLRHFAKYTLSDASPTNTLLTDAPDVYLFATLCEAGPMLRDAELLASYEGKLTRAIGELNRKDGRSKSLQTLATEPGQLLRHGRRDGYNINTDV
jgi:hypothetical protein